MKFSFLFIFLFAARLICAQNYYPSAQEWERREASTLGMDGDSLQAAVDFALAHEYRGSRDLRLAILEGFSREPYHYLAGPVKPRGGPAGVILKGGYIVASWGDVDRVDMTFSVTKSYLSTLAGLALDQGLIDSLGDRVSQYVWDGTFRGEHNSKITWDHLLTQSSDWSGELFGMKDWADRPPRSGGIDDWKSRELREPGTFFEYNDVRVNVLAYSLLQVWRTSLPRVLKREIMDPIGASTTWRWWGYENSFVNIDGVMTQSVSGGGHSGGGMWINTLDQARFGLLFARQGRWKDDQLISQTWVKAVQEASAPNPSYGYMWWLNRGNRKWQGVGEDLYYAAGLGGNYIVVDQKNDLVIALRWLDPSNMEAFMQKLVNSLKN